MQLHLFMLHTFTVWCQNSDTLFFTFIMPVQIILGSTNIRKSAVRGQEASTTIKSIISYIFGSSGDGGVEVIVQDDDDTQTPGVSRQAVRSGEEVDEIRNGVGVSSDGVGGNGGGRVDIIVRDEKYTQTPGVSRQVFQSGKK